MYFIIQKKKISFMVTLILCGLFQLDHLTAILFYDLGDDERNGPAEHGEPPCNQNLV